MAFNINKLSASYLMQYFKTTKTFERIYDKVKITSFEHGNCTAELTVEEDHTNPMGTLHGGLSAALVDTMSSFALMTHSNGNAASVSLDMHITYLKSANIGDTLEINVNTLKAGKTLAFLDILIKNKQTGDTLVKGSHTKYFIR